MTTRRLSRVFLFSLFSILILSLAACGLQIQRKDQGPSVRLPRIPSKIEDIETVQVNFKVQSPETDLDEFQLALDILDDLSGYQDNISRYPMTSLGDNQFEVSVKLDKGFDFRYRYIMVSPAEVHETTLMGQDVELRVGIAEKGLQINDIIANWATTPITRAYGTFSGYLKDHKTQKGIPDLLISIAGMHTFTDMTGFFRIENIPEGTHNMVALAVDGSYALLQQLAIISPNANTRIDVRLVALEKVKVRFLVKPSNDTIGVPIRLAGNFAGQGAHYSKHFTKNGSIASLMPLLSQIEQDQYSLDLELYAGSPFRYRYTLGNGYINAERSQEGHLVSRKFIVPKSSTQVEDQILTWRADDKKPITVYVDTPVNTPPEEVVSIQLYRNDWTQPIPMWHINDQKWMYLLFSPGVIEHTELRFCRNDNCDFAWDENSYASPVVVSFNEGGEVNHQVTEWHNWSAEGDLADSRESSGWKTFLTGVELGQNYRPGDLPYISKSLSNVWKSGVNWLILRPAWDVLEVNGLPIIQTSESDHILYRDLIEVTKTAQSIGMKVAIFPKLSYPTHPEDWWQSATRSDAFWQQWYQQYAGFLNNFSIFAETYKVDHLIIGEDHLQFSLPGGLTADGEKLATPDTAQETWLTMLDQVHKTYKGKLLWASSLDLKPNQSLVDRLDGFYLLINYSLDIQDGNQLKNAIESYPSSVDGNHQKTTYMALNIPALNSEALEYTDHMEPIIASISNGNEAYLDLNKQSQLYRDYSCALMDFDWLSGISSRGFNAAIHLTDISSSIYGKPAMDEFLNCTNNSQ